MKIYIAGKITGYPEYKEKFLAAQQEFEKEGHAVLNPAILPGGFEQDEYMNICYAMIDVCDAVFFLDNWRDSKGANLEHVYAFDNNKWIKYQL